jgi:putative ABC transport system ATP-binding protein
LSGGEQQRVAIARARPAPDAAVCRRAHRQSRPCDGEQIIELLRPPPETGATLVIITHDEALAARAQRIIRLSDGVIVSDENVSDEIV